MSAALPATPDAPPAEHAPGDALPSGEAAPFTEGVWKRLTPGRQPLGAIIVLLLALTFVADIVSPEVLHVGILFNVCIGLTLWSWRARWVVNVTAATVLLRLLAHFIDPAVHGQGMDMVDMFNMVTGLTVQTLTGALIWRHVLVQRKLEARERHAVRQARELAVALAGAQQAARDAEQATERERYARLREVDARTRERKTFQDLERIKNLSVALHRAVLPAMPSEFAGGRVRVASRYAPAEREIQIGGDFYDVLSLREDGTRFGLVIGDVAGHGVEAAAQTALVTSTLRTIALDGAYGPAHVLARTARALEGQLESFVSLAYVIFDTTKGTLTYGNAGHEPPLLVERDGTWGPLMPTGALLGIGLWEFDECWLPLVPGQTLVLITDGLTEVRPPQGEMLGWDGFAEMAARQAGQCVDMEQMADGLLGDVRAFAVNNRLTDDIALVLTRFTG